MNHLLQSLINIIIALFFILIGIVGILIPWSINVRNLLTRFIFEDALAISLFGFTFFVIGLALVVNILLTNKRRHYNISSEKGSTTVEEAVVQEYLNTYWKQLYPTTDIPCHLTVRDNKIHIAVDLPYLPLPEQKPLLEKVRQDLIEIFAKILGYREDFFLSASFQDQKKLSEKTVTP